jgi:hypothetical protein
MKLIRDYKENGFTFILNIDMIKPHWEVAKRNSVCRLCGKTISKGERRFIVEVDFDHPHLSTYYYVIMKFYFCNNHSVREIEAQLGISMRLMEE